MKHFLLIVVLSSCIILPVKSNEILPQYYTQNYMMPYRIHNNWLRLANTPYERLHPELFQTNPYNSKYDTVLSRMEKEWLKKQYESLSDEERISQLEEKIFGTIHSGDLQMRCDQLSKAFNAQKTMQSRHQRTLQGVPTSIPMNIDEFIEY